MQEKLLVREGKSVLKLDKKNIDTDKLIALFMEFPDRTIYITDHAKYDNDRIIGIITQGDFKRNLDGRKTILCNDKFTVCSYNEEKNIKCIFEQKKKIMSIPVLDESGEILKEYYRVPEKKQGRDYFTFVEHIYQEAYLSTYDVNLFVLDSFSEEQKKRAARIEEFTQGKIILTDNIYAVFQELERRGIAYNNTWVYDMQTENLELAHFFCQRKNIPNVFLDEGWIGSLKRVKYLSNYFTGIAYLDINYDLDKRLEETACFCKKYTIHDFIWDDELKCYRCIREVPEEIEVFFTYLKLSKDRFYVVTGDRYVPVISRFCDLVRLPNIGEQVSDEDIAFNIIPNLEKQGVKCIAIEYPQKEYDALPQDKKFLSKSSDVGIINPDIGGEDHEIFWKASRDWKDAFLKERREWQVIQKEGFLELGNMHGKYINYHDGERYTCGNPKKYDNTIFLFGACNVWGSTVADIQTLGSCMREKISKKYYIKNCGEQWENINYMIRRNKYKRGDVVVIFTSRNEPYYVMGIPLYSIWDAYRKMPNPEDNVWDKLYHGNYIETKYIADVLQKLVNNRICLDKYDEMKKDMDVTFGSNVENHLSIPDGLKEWLRISSAYKISGKKSAGAIVMNCNPFTWGHRYLVERAKKQVEVLYLFVLEENKSFFDFQDRLNMVKIGVCDLENVIVIPSGKYIISSGTLPGYFEKEDNPEAEFDATEDLEIFGKIIAKEFGIQIRFAGEEPSDQFTNRYNGFMRELLPKYGVEFCEIPRKELAGEVISASKVRECIRDKKYERLKKLVMPDIYNYLNECHFLE